MPESKITQPAADARNTILEAAIALFAEHGFHGTTMRDIARRAEVSQGLLHHHFGTKDGLWRIAGERLSNDFVTYVAAALANEAPGNQAIPHAMRTYLAYWREHPAAFRFNLWRLLEGPPGERAERSQRLTSRIVPLFKRAQDEGYLRDDLPTGLVLIIAGALIQFWLHSRMEIEDALAVTGDPLPTDDAFLEIVFSLIEAGGEARFPKQKKRRQR